MYELIYKSCRTEGVSWIINQITYYMLKRVIYKVRWADDEAIFAHRRGPE